MLKALKDDSVTAGIPVIILSSLSQQNEEKLKKAGAAEYFEKAKLIDDVNSGKLNAAIEKAVREAKLAKPKNLAASQKA